MQNEVKLSKLVFLDTDKDEEPQWKSDSLPPLLGGWRYSHASVVVKDKETDQQIVVVIGGYKSISQTDSVLLMNLGNDKKEWKEAPNLNPKRHGHAAVVCNGFVYVLGGFCNGCGYLDSIERIAVDDMLETTCTTNNKKQWTTLNCCLSTPRYGCAAAVVHDRFIMVAGGSNGSYLSSTDIIDTMQKTGHSVIVGPSMKVARHFCAMAVVDRRIFVVGGYNGNVLNSVEYLEFNEASQENKETAGFIFPSSSEWTIHKDLVLSVQRYQHAVVQVGSCVIVSGGLRLYDYDYTLKSAEVLDTERNVVFNLPDMALGRIGPSMVSMSGGLVVIGGYELDSSETLPLIDIKDHIKVRGLSQCDFIFVLRKFALTSSSACSQDYSCRAELHMEIENVQGAIQAANLEPDNVQLLESAVKAESLLPRLQSRFHDDKFRSVSQLEEEISQLQQELRQKDGFKARIPVAEKIQKLKELVSKNKQVEHDRKLASQHAEYDHESASMTGHEQLPASGRPLVENTNGCDDPEDRFVKLEDMMIEQRTMMVQLSDRLGSLEHAVFGKDEN